MNINSWLVDTITVASVTSINNYGEPTYGSNTSVSARVENTDKILRNADGNEVQADNVIATNTEIKMDDKIWLPNEDASTDSPHRPIKIKYAKTKNGSYGFYEVYL